MLKSVPPNCTVVGVPGRIVVRDGMKIEGDKIEIDLEHHMLPDPIADTLEAMQGKIEQLEKQLAAIKREVKASESLQHPNWEKRGTSATESA